MKSVKGSYGTYRVLTPPVSKGGIGSIYRTADATVVYKEYHSTLKAPQRQALDRLVHIGRDTVFNRRLGVGATPVSSINWPLDIICDPAGRIIGVILPAIPADLFNQYGKPRTLEFLIMKRAQPPRANVRLALLLRMAEILAHLDAQALVHGDINGKNLAWRAAPNPVMYLIDCDGIVGKSPPPAKGVQALGWTDPRVADRLVPAHDHLSDWYGLALAMYRGLLLVPGNITEKKNGRWPKPGMIPRQLNSRVANLLHRALDDPLNGSARPSPSEWVQTLVDVYLKRGSFNERELRELDRLADHTATVPSTPPPTRTTSQATGRPRAPRQPPAQTWPIPPPTPTPTQPVPTQPVPTKPVPTRPVPTKPVPTRPSLAQPSPLPSSPRPSSSLPQSQGVFKWFGDAALRNDAAWHGTSVLLALCCSPLAFVHLAVSAVQVLRAPPSRGGRKRALAYCCCYGVLAVSLLLCSLSVSNSS